jgi:hypothetical protein
MPAILAHSPVQLVAQLITRAHHSERIPTKPYDRMAHDARIREHEDEMKRAQWGPGFLVGTEV